MIVSGALREQPKKKTTNAENSVIGGLCSVDLDIFFFN